MGYHTRIMTKKILFQNAPVRFQSMSLNDCQLQEMQVDIWQLPLTDPPKWVSSLLTPDEHARAQLFHFPKHQRRFAVSRATLRVILAQYLHVSPLSLHFELNPQGKPELLNHRLQFNVSHSQDTALIAIGQDHELGVDLEYFSDRPYLGIAEHCFSPSEIKCVKSVPASRQALTFFNIWAQKEAFIKAVGMGLSYPLQEFSVTPYLQAPYLLTDHLTQQPWRLSSFMPQPACSAALCVNPNVEIYRYIKLNTVHTLEVFL